MAASAPGSLALAVLVRLLVDVFAALAVLVALAAFETSAVFEAMATFAALSVFVALAVFVETLGFSHGAQKYFRDASKGANADPV